MNPTHSYYEKNAPDLVRRYERAEVSHLHRQLLEAFPAGARLLEIGSGSGREAAFLLDRGMDVECLEASAALAAQAELIHPALAGRIHRGAVPLCYPADPASLDGVYAVASLMHLQISDLEHTLDLIHQSLKPRGRLFFSVPLRRPGLDDAGCDRDGRFFLMMDPPRWENLVAPRGFTLLKSDTIGDGLGREEVLWGNWLWAKG